MRNKGHISLLSYRHGRRDAKTLEERRLKAAKFFKQGKTQAEVANYFHVSREAASQWYEIWSKDGLKGLKAKKRPGRPSRLNAEDRMKIERALLKGPQAFGYLTDIWTLERIKKVIKQVANVNYHKGHVWKVLLKMGWSCQKPEKKLKERNEQSIKHWVRYVLPHIKKKPKKSRRLLVS